MTIIHRILSVQKILRNEHPYLQPILPHITVLLSSRYSMIATTTIDLNSCMRQSDRKKYENLPFSPHRLRKRQVWISINTSDPIKLMLFIQMVYALYVSISIASTHLQMRMNGELSKIPNTRDFCPKVNYEFEHIRTDHLINCSNVFEQPLELFMFDQFGIVRYACCHLILFSV